MARDVGCGRSKLDLFGLLGVAWFDRVEEFRFADDSVLDWEDVLAIVTTGSAGNDSLYGAYYTDTLDGKAGTDFLSGGDDGDTYLFGLGYGSDTIEDRQTNVLTQTADTVRFGAGIAVADVAFHRDGTTKDLLITIAGSPDTLRVKNQRVARVERSETREQTWPASKPPRMAAGTRFAPPRPVTMASRRSCKRAPGIAAGRAGERYSMRALLRATAQRPGGNCRQFLSHCHKYLYNNTDAICN